MFIEEKVKISLEEYLEKEYTAQTKSEYINYQIIPVAFSSENHGQIASNLSGNIGICLKGKDYRLYIADRMLFVQAHELDIENGNAYYPDLMIVEGQPQSRQMSANMTATINPVVLVEILSMSNSENDLTYKLFDYKRIASLKQYLIIYQDRKHIETFKRIEETNEWLNHGFSEKDESINILNCQILIADIYDKVSFEIGSR